ncbi:TonB-dependent receptor plug domain-containing protein [Synergistes jonesii]|uniref:TonB-dependent receptor plug domain-containing protein n=1 Tax=Synergistes jonesii TaxID=2754 RepID=UPI0033293B0A
MRIYLFITALCLFLCAGAAAADNAVSLPEEKVTADAEREEKLLLSPGTVTVIKPQEMKGEQKNLPELLKQVPGLHVIETKGRGAYTTASVRGSSSSQVAVYVDGVLMNLGSEPAVDLSTIPVENVERIEVYRGYIPARFGGASMGGVINIVTVKPKKAGCSAAAGVGSFGRLTGGLTYHSPLGEGAFMGSVNFDRTDGDFEYWNDNNTPYTPDDDYKAKRQNSGYKNSNLLLKWNGDKWKIEGGWKRNDRELPYSAPGADKFDSVPGAAQVTDQWNAIVMRRDRLGDLDYGLRLEYLHQTKDYDDPENKIGGWGEQHNRYETKRFGAAVDGSLPLGDRHLVEFLWNYYNEELHTMGDVVKKFGGRERHTRNSWNGQIQDTISLNKAGDLWFTPIVRWNAAEGVTEFSWGAALTKKFYRGWTLKLTGGTYNRAPNLYELYGDGAFIVPNRELEWEDGTQYDAGVSWEGEISKAQVRAELTYFYRKSNNLIDYLMVNPRYAQYVNIGEAKISGVELEATVKRDKWDIYLSATWMNPKNKTPGYMYDDPLPNRPEFEGLLRVSRKIFKDDRAKLFAELHHIGKNYYDMQGEVGWDDLTTLGLGMHWQIRDGLKLVFGVDDVFNSGPDVMIFAVGNGPERVLWYPIQGRTFYAALLWTF